MHRGREVLHGQPFAFLHHLPAANLRERPSLVQFPSHFCRHCSQYVVSGSVCNEGVLTLASSSYSFRDTCWIGYRQSAAPGGRGEGKSEISPARTIVPSSVRSRSDGCPTRLPPHPHSCDVLSCCSVVRNVLSGITIQIQDTLEHMIYYA